MKLFKYVKTVKPHKKYVFITQKFQKYYLQNFLFFQNDYLHNWLANFQYHKTKAYFNICSYRIITFFQFK